MTEEVTIISYFTFPGDLADEMHEWLEFVVGEGYSVDLRAPDTGESVTVRLIEVQDEQPHVAVKGTRRSPLFEKVVGRVVWALSKNSDNLLVDSREIKAEPSGLR